jgi:hypothetical protein
MPWVETKAGESNDLCYGKVVCKICNFCVKVLLGLLESKMCVVNNFKDVEHLQLLFVLYL